jgi:hypothetical protein
MPSLNRDQRRALESVVIEARKRAEAGARKALEQLGVSHHEAWTTMSPLERALRTRLRARGKQLGDGRDERRGTQAIDKLALECAYEQWHRMLFARFLAECGVLVEPMSGVSISIDECRGLAREQGTDWLVLACSFAQRMLPQIFRVDDPVLDVMLPPEYRQALEDLLAGLPTEVFLADDSLGWVYQFWQSEQKDIVNRSEKKIGAEELPAVTQLFTEDYMVLFLLHNTLGAWWAGKLLAERPELAQRATTEEELRDACALPDVDWTYLRFIRNEDETWRPAAGSFPEWPTKASDIRILDPCMGSGHFLVFALPILVAMRVAEERLTRQMAVDAVLGENLFGLEIDARCTQIAAFNIALASWKAAGYRPLPRLHLACSGLSVSAKESEWIALADTDERQRTGMARLYRLFQQAPTLGSLIEPSALAGDVLEAGFVDLRPLLEQAVARESTDDASHEMAITARGLAEAAEILSGAFTIVATNVPYLGRGKQDALLRQYCDEHYPSAKADLATCFVERCITFLVPGGTATVVSPQNWWFLTSYRKLRERLLTRQEFNFVSTLGEEAWQTFGDRGPVATLMTITCRSPLEDHEMATLDALPEKNIARKMHVLARGIVGAIKQSDQLANPDHRITIEASGGGPLLSVYAASFQGISPADFAHFGRQFWEVEPHEEWKFWQSAVETTKPYGGRSLVLWWNGDLQRAVANGQAYIRGELAWGKRGVACRQMRELSCSLYTGDLFDTNTAVIVPFDEAHLTAVWSFCTSTDFEKAVRRIDRKVNVTNASLVKVPFDLKHWSQIAKETYPSGLPAPTSNEPNQWLFSGNPKHSTAPLQVAVGRLVGYRWPRQTGSEFDDCPSLGPDGLELHEDADGIVALGAIRGEAPGADRLLRLLADAFGNAWSASVLATLLSDVGFVGRSLDDWLRERFFEQHCDLFDQRPFVWHIWDGRRDGFQALVNYHKLAAPGGEGRRTLETLIYTYLGDWLDRQRADQKLGVEGADGRLASAEHLKRQLEAILIGESPYDVFVRWKPLHDQSVGWDPDINDGVRINIRPFMNAKPLESRGKSACILRVAPNIRWDKDRGTEQSRSADDYPWFWSWDGRTDNFTGGKTFDGSRWNDLHYTREFKIAARRKAGLA